MLEIMRGFCIALAMVCVPAAYASVVSWDLVNVSFEDGATATGHFTLDTVSNQVTNFDIFTTAGNSIPSAFQYTPATARITEQLNQPGNAFLRIASLPDLVAGSTRELFLSFSKQLVLGGMATLIVDDAFGQPSYEKQSGGEMSALRLVSGAGVVDPPIPEPAAVVGLAVGLFIVGATAWHRSRCDKVKPSRARRTIAPMQS